MKARIRHRVVNHGLSDEDRARWHRSDLVVGEVIVTFRRAADTDAFLAAIKSAKTISVECDADRVVRFSCDPGKELRLAQTIGAIIARLTAIADAEDDIASLTKGRGGLEKIAW